MKGFFVNVHDNRDGLDRDFCHTRATIVARDAEPVACIVVDISPGGARILVDADREIPNRLELVMQAHQGLDEHYHCELRWRSHDQIGVKFLP